MKPWNRLIGMNPWNRFIRGGPRTAVFILGCQRSGTTMLEKVLGSAEGVSLYGEGNRKAMKTQQGYRLRDDSVLRNLIRRDRNPFIVFKPLNDSQHVDRLLGLHEHVRVIWIYRHYHDTINSMIRKWGDSQKRTVTWLRDNVQKAGAAEWDGKNQQSFYAERLTDEGLSVLRELVTPEMTAEDAAGIMWYLRNRIYFDRNLQERSNALLIRYEELATSPMEQLGRIFEFVGLQGHEECAREIKASSVGREKPPALAPAIRDLCDGMLGRLDAAKSSPRISTR